MSGEDDKKTNPPVDRVLGQAQLTGTGIVKMRDADLAEHRLDVEAEVAKAKIAADLETRRIEADLEGKRIAAAAATAGKEIDAKVDDNRGDNARAGIRTAGIALTAIIGTAGAVIITAMALYYRQPIMLSAFGYDLSTGGMAPPVEKPVDDGPTEKAPLAVVPSKPEEQDTDLP